VEEARASLNQARASLRQAEASLRYQQAQLDKAVIKSPIAGTVLTVTTQQGETVASAFQVATLVTVADLNRLEVRAYVDEVDIGKVRLGLPAELRVDSFPDRVFKGRVTKISGSSTVKDNVVTYETFVALENQEGLLRPDMTADVTLLLGRRSNVIKIPSEAVHREMKGSLVYVLHRDKVGKQRVEKRTVTVGVDDGSQVEVVSGVKEGEEVVLAGLPRLGVEAVDAQRKTQKSDDQ
jgi:RND family efflux transporter MFP subunit